MSQQITSYRFGWEIVSLFQPQWAFANRARPVVSICMHSSALQRRILASSCCCISASRIHAGNAPRPWRQWRPLKCLAFHSNSIQISLHAIRRFINSGSHGGVAPVSPQLLHCPRKQDESLCQHSVDFLECRVEQPSWPPLIWTSPRVRSWRWPNYSTISDPFSTGC